MFVHRWDTWCVQDATGRYARQWSQLGPATLAKHLQGDLTLAMDSAGRDGMAKWLCLDSDQPDGLATLEQVRRVFADLNLMTLLEQSRRGGHLWLLCADPVPSALLRRIATHIMGMVPRLGPIEVYPNSDVPAGLKGITHVVRLPLGVHQVTKQHYPFVDGSLRPCHRNDAASGLSWLLGQSVNTSAWLHAALHQLEVRAQPSPPEPLSAPARKVQGGMIRWANVEADLLEVIQATKPEVSLRPSGQGYIGWCPWHDDTAPDTDGTPGTPSLYVIQNQRYGWSWRCLSTNCGAHDEVHMHHTFDWFEWCCAGDVAAAIALAAQYQERRE
jgi:hypothetical protein